MHGLKRVMLYVPCGLRDVAAEKFGPPQLPRIRLPHGHFSFCTPQLLQRFHNFRLDDMAVSTGKRKRSEDEDDSSQDEGATRALFQRAFESEFKPLPRLKQVSREPEPEHLDVNDDSGEDCDWGGLSDSDGKVEVIDHEGVFGGDQDIQIKDKKAFMVCGVKRHPRVVTLIQSIVIKAAKVRRNPLCSSKTTKRDFRGRILRGCQQETRPSTAAALEGIAPA